MRQITVELSKEHETLPLAELKAVLSIYDSDYKIAIHGNTAEITSTINPELLISRLAMAKSVNNAEIGQNFEQRRPKNRPFKHPSAMEPKVARVMVNLSRAKEGKTLLDPFCGTGGILLEGALVGSRIAGIELNSEIYEGCSQNLEHFGISGYNLVEGDMRNTVIKADAVATDPPYGKNTKLQGTLGNFYAEALEAVQKDLKSGGYCCISSPTALNLQKLAEFAGFEPIEEHVCYVNKDMSKRICVLKQPSAD
jgi:tRNA (guanine10-N2)-dimethyltransferase